MKKLVLYLLILIVFQGQSIEHIPNTNSANNNVIEESSQNLLSNENSKLNVLELVGFLRFF